MEFRELIKNKAIRAQIVRAIMRNMDKEKVANFMVDIFARKPINVNQTLDIYEQINYFFANIIRESVSETDERISL